MSKRIRLLRRGPNNSVLVNIFPLPAQSSPGSRGSRIGNGAATATFYRQLREVEAVWVYGTWRDRQSGS